METAAFSDLTSSDVVYGVSSPAISLTAMVSQPMVSSWRAMVTK